MSNRYNREGKANDNKTPISTRRGTERDLTDWGRFRYQVLVDGEIQMWLSETDGTSE